MKHVPDLCLPSNLKIEESMAEACVISYAELWVMEHNEMKVRLEQQEGASSARLQV